MYYFNLFIVSKLPLRLTASVPCTYFSYLEAFKLINFHMSGLRTMRNDTVYYTSLHLRCSLYKVAVLLPFVTSD
jgi:hypothetical protein